MTKIDADIGAACDWTVSGMDCGSCANKIKDAVARLPGVSGVEIGLMSERLRLTLDETKTSREKVEKVVKSLGYGLTPRAAGARKEFVLPGDAARTEHGDEHAGHDHSGHDHSGHDHSGQDHKDHDHDGHDHSGHDHKGHGHGPKPPAAAAAKRDDSGHGSPGHVHDDPADRGKRWYQTGKGRLVILTGLIVGVASIIEYLTPGLGRWAFTAATLIAVAPAAQRAFAALRMGQPFTIEGLLTIAAVGALFIDAAEEAALVVFLFAVGEVLEGVAAGKARDGIRALANLVPKTAQLVTGDTTREVPAASLTVGQTVLVRPGDRIPADGEITEGNSGVDDSPVTGESVPVNKGPGDSVFAGSINTEAVLRVKVTKDPEDNTIARIIRLVEEAEEARAPTERFIDRFSRWYMPAIVAVAALVLLYTIWRVIESVAISSGALVHP
ncbi:MAG: heavy metal translocating P-type ATPase [Pseudomonadota bacterium]